MRFWGQILGHNWHNSLQQKWFETFLSCKHCIWKPQVWKLSRLWPETSMKLYVHEFGFSIVRSYRGRRTRSLVPALPTSIMYFWSNALLTATIKDNICLSFCCRLSHSRLFFTVSWERFLYPPTPPPPPSGVICSLRSRWRRSKENAFLQRQRSRQRLLDPQGADRLPLFLFL